MTTDPHDLIARVLDEYAADPHKHALNLEKPTRAELLIECERLKADLEHANKSAFAHAQQAFTFRQERHRLRLALVDLWDLVQSYEFCEPTRDLPLEESELIDASVRENVVRVLAEIQA